MVYHLYKTSTTSQMSAPTYARLLIAPRLLPGEGLVGKEPGRGRGEPADVNILRGTRGTSIVRFSDVLDRHT